MRINRAGISYFIFLFCLVPAFTQESENILNLDEVLAQLAFSTGNVAQLSWDSLFQSGAFSFMGHKLVFSTGAAGSSGYALLDGSELIILPHPFIKDGELFFPESFLTTLKNFLDKIDDPDSDFRIAAIVIDPGHGGKDPGATATRIIKEKQTRVAEKDIVLAVSKNVYNRLLAAYPDKQVLLTRSSDTFLSLEERVAIANAIPLGDNDAIIYLSIHANSSFNRAARGYEVWYLDPHYRRDLVDPEKYSDSKEVIPILNAMLEEEFTRESILMAESIIHRFDEILGKELPSRGIKAEDWFVVRNARMPSVLVELGFISNEQDLLLMTNPQYVQSFGEALYQGIADFIVKFEQHGGFITIE
ncbi:MAG: N-acetylmuramoyl-L-alanine amidase [Spirochaetaceae bacterium]|jgi:N-acetylmuramoyl-L-alanine amidase|nr:N-acetylmuramoyl-L-alanine amidase [Spirochaetaceae bacterium]